MKVELFLHVGRRVSQANDVRAAENECCFWMAAQARQTGFHRTWVENVIGIGEHEQIGSSCARTRVSRLGYTAVGLPDAADAVIARDAGGVIRRAIIDDNHLDMRMSLIGDAF